MKHPVSLLFSKTPRFRSFPSTILPFKARPRTRQRRSKWPFFCKPRMASSNFIWSPPVGGERVVDTAAWMVDKRDRSSKVWLRFADWTFLNHGYFMWMVYESTFSSYKKTWMVQMDFAIMDDLYMDVTYMDSAWMVQEDTFAWDLQTIPKGVLISLGLVIFTGIIPHPKSLSVRKETLILYNICDTLWYIIFNMKSRP